MAEECQHGRGVPPRPRSATMAEECYHGRGVSPWPRSATTAEECHHGRGVPPWPRSATMAEECHHGRGVPPWLRSATMAEECHHGRGVPPRPRSSTPPLLNCACAVTPSFMPHVILKFCDSGRNRRHRYNNHHVDQEGKTKCVRDLQGNLMRDKKRNGKSKERMRRTPERTNVVVNSQFNDWHRKFSGKAQKYNREGPKIFVLLDRRIPSSKMNYPST